MGKVIAIANQKGGTSKTTSTVNIGAGLAREGKRVLLIDADPQGSLTASLGYVEPDELENTLSTILARIINEDWEDDRDGDSGETTNRFFGMLPHEEGMTLLPANIELSGLEVSLVNVMSRETILRRYIESIRKEYDYILIDCTPSLGMLTLNALTAADSVLIPVQAEYLPVKGLQQLLETITRVKRRLNSKLEIEGILMAMTNSRTVYGREFASFLRRNYGGKVTIFKSDIPHSVRASEASSLGISIFEHDPHGKVAEAYRSLVQEILNNSTDISPIFHFREEQEVRAHG